MINSRKPTKINTNSTGEVFFITLCQRPCQQNECMPNIPFQFGNVYIPWYQSLHRVQDNEEWGLCDPILLIIDISLILAW